MIVSPPVPKLEHPSGRLHQDLAAEVEGVLWAYAPLRSSIVELDVTADDGHVTLQGIVRGSGQRSMAGRLVLGVAGVTELRNELLTDTDLESNIAVALAGDAATRLITDRVSVKSLMGTVYLGGTVAAPRMAQAEAACRSAEDIARSVTGVRDVVNRLEAVERAETGAPEGETAGAAGAEAGGLSAAMQERLQVWRERAKA